jgi:hypothetical protein
MLDTVSRWCLMINSCFFVISLSRRYPDIVRRYADTQIRRYADTQIRRYADRFSPVMSSNQLPEVVVGFSSPPHPRRISKLSRKYWRDKHLLRQESMPVIPVNPNHPVASAARKRKRTPRSAAIRESPPRAAKTRENNALMHGASAPPPPPCHDVASVGVASVATDAGNAASLASALAVSTATLAATAGSPACSVNSSNDSSNSEDSDVIAGGG